jgi:alpha-glucuronidase
MHHAINVVVLYCFRMKKSPLILVYLISLLPVRAEDGYDLWLRYHLTDNASLLQQYRAGIAGILIQGNSATLSAAREELSVGLKGLLGKAIPALESHYEIRQNALAGIML